MLNAIQTIPKHLVGTVSKYGFQRRIATTLAHIPFEPQVLRIAEALLLSEHMHVDLVQRSNHDQVYVSFCDNDCVFTHA